MQQEKTTTQKPGKSGKAPAKPKKKPGRNSALTPEVRDIIVAAVKAGNFLSTAADFAGVSPKTVYEWIARGEGRDPDRPPTAAFAAFAAAIKKSESHGAIAAHQRIQEAARGQTLRQKLTITRVVISSTGEPVEVTEVIERYYPPVWQAAAWFLERRFPDKWGRRDRINHASPDSDKVEHNVEIQTLISKICGDAG